MRSRRWSVALSLALLAVAADALTSVLQRATGLVAHPEPLPPSADVPPSPPNEDAESLETADNGNLIFSEGTLLPHVKCIEYMTLAHSQSAPLFQAQMEALGLWGRVTVHVAPPDPDGKAAGCFRAHINAWNAALARGCESALLLEEDVYFNEPVVQQSLAAADGLVASGVPFDMTFLGYTPQQNISEGVLMSELEPRRFMLGSIAPFDGGAFECVYRLHDWLCTQAYIISRAAMARWKGLTYTPGVTPPIDVYLSTRFDHGGFFAVRPAVGFQRYHTPAAGVTGAEETGSANEVWKFIPGVFYSIYEPDLYLVKAGIHSPARCLPPPAAYSYVGLPTAVREFAALSHANHSDEAVIEWAGPPDTWASVDAHLTTLLRSLRNYDGPTDTAAFTDEPEAEAAV